MSVTYRARRAPNAELGANMRMTVLTSKGAVERPVALTDAELVEAAKARDRDAFQTLVERHQSLVFSFASSLTGSLLEAEEVAQETFVTAWIEIRTLRRPDRFRTWICG